MVYKIVNFSQRL